MKKPIKVSGSTMKALAAEPKKPEPKPVAKAPEPKPAPRPVVAPQPVKQAPVEVRVDTDRLERIAVDSSKHLLDLASKAIADIKATSELYRRDKRGVRMTVNRDHKGLIESIDVVPIQPTEH